MISKPRPKREYPGARIQGPKVMRVIGLQLLGSISLASAGWVLGDLVIAYSLLAGGLVCALPNLVFAWMAFRFQGARAAKRVVSAFYKAEMLKFGLTVVLFAGVFALVRPLNPIFFFVAYVAVQALHWLSPWIIKVR